ncbi:SUMO-activating enzyme subunit 2-like [Schistocerca gregaria]|uniref:SUMO-activating enzyme subunit 2-like n=1 Tax=Schistocerca gregaria TaxID=7010 RepID=UPI00211F31FE|nr:SUMO-activating enzyme subunit 2-like [Schistocerca gregaria]
MWEKHRLVHGDDDLAEIRRAKVLVVGAGGIGCELAKNLVMAGIQSIDLIDLDTIDVSNLNRQFLFRRRHVGQPKAVVAKESAVRYAPDLGACRIEAHFDDIKSQQYGVDYVGKFDVVLNALDNLEARRHVNRVCLAAKTPFVDSGTNGWLGQVQPFIFDRTGCFECEPKPAPKQYPVCTIRSRPSMPIHAVIWAKELFSSLFEREDGVAAFLREGGYNVRSSRAQEMLDQDEKMLEKKNGVSRIFHQVFYTDILHLDLLLESEARASLPVPCRVAEASDEPSPEVRIDRSRPFPVLLIPQKLLSTEGPVPGDHEVWDVGQCARIFFESTRQLLELVSPASREGKRVSWDKDQNSHLDFVTAASNLRCAQFNMSMQSRFDVKSQAGQIVPSIATTNAIVAGLVTLEAIKILTKNFERCRQTFLTRVASKKSGYLLTSEPDEKNPECGVCSRHFVYLHVDTANFRLKAFVDVLREELDISQPSILVSDHLIYESGEEGADEEFAQLLQKPISQLYMTNGAIAYVEDYSTDLSVQVVVRHADRETADSSRAYALEGGRPTPRASPVRDASAPDDEGAVELVDQEDPAGAILIE